MNTVSAVSVTGSVKKNELHSTMCQPVPTGHVHPKIDEMATHIVKDSTMVAMPTGWMPLVDTGGYCRMTWPTNHCPLLLLLPSVKDSPRGCPSIY